MAFILTSIAGLSTMIGCIFIFYDFKNTNKIINIALSFAAGVMLTVSITDLIPESLNLMIMPSFLKILYLLISINIGIILSKFLDQKINLDNKLYRVGVISLIAIILHNIPEGIATYMATTYDSHLGICLTISIALHNIPEGISISLPIYYATKSKRRAVMYTLISGLSELFGAIITAIFFKNYINNFVMSLLLGAIAGIMIYISIFELLKYSKDYKSRGLTTLSIIIGSMVMLISHLLIK